MKKFEKIEEAQAAFDSVSDQLEKANAEIKTLEDKNAELVEETNELKSLIDEIRKAKVRVPGHVTFQYDKKTKVVRAAKFKWKGVEYTAEQLASNKAMQKEMIEAGVGIIEDLVEE